MAQFARTLVALLVLVAMVCGGAGSVCACDIQPGVECASTEHQDDGGEHHQHNQPGDDAQCPCATCHSCSHMPVALPGVSLPVVDASITNRHCHSQVRVMSRAAEIFIPPKIG